MPAGSEGDFPGRSSSWYTKLFEYHPSLKAAAVGAAALGAIALVAGLGRRNGKSVSANGEHVFKFGARHAVGRLGDEVAYRLSGSGIGAGQRGRASLAVALRPASGGERMGTGTPRLQI